jgi:hypothetical protein
LLRFSQEQTSGSYPDFDSLMIESVRTSEMPVRFNVTTRRYIPEDSKLGAFSPQPYTTNLYDPIL